MNISKGRLETAWWGPGPDQAPSLVLLHEGLGCVRLWRDFPARLQEATGCGVFAYSRFGYGGSDPIFRPRPMTYMHDEAIDILPEVLDEAGIRKAILIGHSDGGSIATIFAGARSDQRVLGLVTIAGHFFVEELNIAAIRQIKETYESTDLRMRLARYHDDVDGAFYGWNEAWLDPRFKGFNLSRYLEAIRIPTLGLQGADDPYGSDEQLHVLHRLIRAPLQTRLIADARHSPHIERPAVTEEIVTSFVRSLVG